MPAPPTAIVTLAFVLATAGCVGVDRDPPVAAAIQYETPTPDDPTPTTTEADPSTPALPTPRELHAATYDYATPAASPPEADVFQLPAGYRAIEVAVTFTPTPAPVGAGQAPLLELLDAHGSPLGVCRAPIPLTEATPCSITAEPLTPGDYSVRASGVASAEARVQVLGR